MLPAHGERALCGAGSNRFPRQDVKTIPAGVFNLGLPDGLWLTGVWEANEVSLIVPAPYLTLNLGDPGQGKKRMSSGLTRESQTKQNVSPDPEQYWYFTYVHISVF